LTSRASVAPTVLLRCDATDAGGVGHLVRCIALSQAVRAGGGVAVHLSGDVTAPLGRAMLDDSAIRLHPAEQDAGRLLGLAESIGAAVVHVDHYGDFDGLRAAGRARSILTSTAADEQFGRRDADVIIDGSPRALREFDPLYAGAAVGLGPAHLALRAEFSSAYERSSDSQIPSVLIVMGGTDAAGYGPAIAQAITDLPDVGRVGLVGGAPVVGSGPQPGMPIESVPRSTDFRSLLKGWDLVVTGAGTTVWELAALGVPMATVGVAENQRDHYETLVTGGMAVGLGFLPDPAAIDTGALAEVLSDPPRRIRMAAHAHRLVDGRGAARVVDIWRTELAGRSGSGLRVRPAGPADAGRLFAWRNDLRTRMASRSTAPVDWTQHLEWFAGTLERTDRRLFVGTAAGEPVGTTRFDRGVGGEWEVSVTVAPTARGGGWASGLVAESTAQMIGGGQQVSRIVADVRAANRASRALFARLGYRLERADGEWEHWAAEPERLRADPS
jgi:spore coat polysaccharide biosynthesis predicted glycosyltransferase SpsG/L-amino acid N-acyltransferase YncA